MSPDAGVKNRSAMERAGTEKCMSGGSSALVVNLFERLVLALAK